MAGRPQGAADFFTFFRPKSKTKDELDLEPVVMIQNTGKTHRNKSKYKLKIKRNTKHKHIDLLHIAGLPPICGNCVCACACLEILEILEIVESLETLVCSPLSPKFGNFQNSEFPSLVNFSKVGEFPKRMERREFGKCPES